MKIRTQTLSFLQQLRQNNNREWFAEHKDEYLEAHTNALEFAGVLYQGLSEFDQLVPSSPKRTLYRIYRDIRFSKDKTPYKSSFSGRMKRDTALLRGGYYFQIGPDGTSKIVGGFWKPNSADMLRIRREIDMDSPPLYEILKDKTFEKYFGNLHGDEVKTAPRGFTKDHDDIELLRKKQFLLVRNFTDKQVLSKSFLDEAILTYRAMRPFFNYMSEVLTTDENGVPLY